MVNKPRFLDLVCERILVRHYSILTVWDYVGFIKCLLNRRFHFAKREYPREKSELQRL
jgi:hypothetical protein